MKMKNSYNTYFVTLTPRQLFFFGREQEGTADYFLKGSYFPQQTALLGLVRHQILLQNNLMENNKIKENTEAAKWIGEKSFEWNSKEISFGKIDSISPCYLVDPKSKFLPFHSSYCNHLLKIGDNYYLKDFDPKKYYPETWMSIDKSKPITVSEIISEIIKPGIEKNYKGKTEESDKSFYKQVWLKMKRGYSFGFYITINEEVKFKSADVTFGKESSSFQMEVSKPVNVIDKFTDTEEPTALMLLSDTYVEENLISLCEFAVTDTVPFRNFVSNTSNKTDYYKLNKGNSKSETRLMLLKKGSVFYGNIPSVELAINDQKHFKKAGFNHYHLLNINY